MTGTTGSDAGGKGPGALWRSLTADERHGNLPALLLLLTVVTGLIDAVSLLDLGRVFVANMTGNVVFIGFALVGTPGYSLLSSLTALAGFLLGALVGGVATRRRTHHHLLLRDAGAVEVVLIVVAVLVALGVGEPIAPVPGAIIAGVLAIALGLQNTVARRLAVPDLTSTVLTMTLTGLGADQHSSPLVRIRRLLAVLAMGGGAAAGAVIVLQLSAWLGMAVAAVLAAVVTLGAAAGASRERQGTESQTD